MQRQLIRGGTYVAAGVLILFSYWIYEVGGVIVILAISSIIYGLHLMDAYRLSQPYIEHIRTKLSSQSESSHQNTGAEDSQSTKGTQNSTSSSSRKSKSGSSSSKKS